MRTWDLPRAIPALEAWEPWSSLGWYLQGLRTWGRPAALAPHHRAIALAPLDRHNIAAPGGSLVALGRLDEARALARSVRSGSPALRAEGLELEIRIDAMQARFVAALDEAREVIALAPDDAAWVRGVRFDAGWRFIKYPGPTLTNNLELKEDGFWGGALKFTFRAGWRF